MFAGYSGYYRCILVFLPGRPDFGKVPAPPPASLDGSGGGSDGVLT